MNDIQTVLAWLVPVMLGWALLSILYWGIARRVFHDAIIYRIYHKRDELRLLAVKGEVAPNSFEYEFLEKRLCETAYASPEITIFNFIRFCFSANSKSVPAELDKFNRVAPNKLKYIWQEAIDDVKLMMAANSPVIAIIGSFIILVKRFRNDATERVKRFFEIEVVEGSIGCATG